MTEYTFKVNLAGLTSEECFKDASKDELKVLVALIAHQGEGVTSEELSEELELSKARVVASIALFEESGVVVKCDGKSVAEIEYEFALKKCEKVIGSSMGASNGVRNNDTKSFFDELQQLLGKTFVAREIERINTLIEEAGVSTGYILTLAAFLKEKHENLTVERIVRESTRLVNSNVSTFEELELYIADKSQEVAGEWEMRRIFGIYNRSFTKTERAYIKKWLQDFGYGGVIIEEAYDISSKATNDRSFPYIDSILTTWHEAGCKTLEECKAREAMRKQANNTKNANKTSQKAKKTVEAETPKYTDFNSEDALMRALERSYGDSDS